MLKLYCRNAEQLSFVQPTNTSLSVEHSQGLYSAKLHVWLETSVTMWCMLRCWVWLLCFVTACAVADMKFIMKTHLLYAHSTRHKCPVQESIFNYIMWV